MIEVAMRIETKNNSIPNRPTKLDEFHLNIVHPRRTLTPNKRVGDYANIF